MRKSDAKAGLYGLLTRLLWFAVPAGLPEGLEHLPGHTFQKFLMSIIDGRTQSVAFCRENFIHQNYVGLCFVRKKYKKEGFLPAFSVNLKFYTQKIHEPDSCCDSALFICSGITNFAKSEI